MWAVWRVFISHVRDKSTYHFYSRKLQSNSRRHKCTFAYRFPGARYHMYETNQLTIFFPVNCNPILDGINVHSRTVFQVQFPVGLKNLPKRGKRLGTNFIVTCCISTPWAKTTQKTNCSVIRVISRRCARICPKFFLEWRQWQLDKQYWSNSGCKTRHSLSGYHGIKYVVVFLW